MLRREETKSSKVHCADDWRGGSRGRGGCLGSSSILSLRSITNASLFFIRLFFSLNLGRYKLLLSQLFLQRRIDFFSTFFENCGRLKSFLEDKNQISLMARAGCASLQSQRSPLAQLASVSMESECTRLGLRHAEAGATELKKNVLLKTSARI